MKFIIVLLIAILFISTVAKIKYNKSLGISSVGPVIKIIVLPAVFGMLVIGFLLYFFK